MSFTTRRLRFAAAASAAALASVSFGTPTATAAPADPPGTFSVQNLAPTLTAPFASYRIPAMAYVGGDTVVAAWDGRPGSAADSPNPNSIVLRRSTDGGATWSPQTTVLAGVQGTNRIGYSDPSLIWDAEERKLFLFSVYSKDQGFLGSAWGNDDADRQVMSAQVSTSTDLGITWSAPRLITSIVKPGSSSTPSTGSVKGMFATSGEGVQLRYGSYAGRLVQQFAGTVRQANGTDTVQAYSVYSDDHGATWKRGQFVGTGLDENKTVELSDGRVLLNSRSGGGYRRVAVSTDGGVSYGPVSQDLELPDPTNNASITRLFPDAAPGTPEARVLLFTNSNSQSSRSNLTARVSCDDGNSWPYARQIAPGFAAYSTATRLGDGQIGVLYESSYTTGIQFVRVDDAWLNYSCDGVEQVGGVTVAGSRNDGGRNLATTPYAAGQDVPYRFTVTSQASGSVTVAPTGGNFVPLVPAGAGNCRYTGLAAGGTYSCTTPRHTVTAAEAAAGYFVPDTNWVVSGASTGAGRVLGTPVPLRSGIQAGAATVAGVTIAGARGDSDRDVVANPYAVGQTVPYRFTVTNTSGSTVDVVPTAGNLAPFLPPGAGNCRYTGLAPGASYVCATTRHTVTATEAGAGYFVPDTTWTVRTGATSTPSRVLGAPVTVR